MHPKQKEIFWSAKLAYAVGLITTDGNLSSDGRHFDFTSNDRDLIETFKNCLGIKNKIARKRSGYTARLSSHRVQFGNVTLYDWLVNNVGLMPNKSKRLGKLNIPTKFFFDFLRGHLDGDGTIRRYYDPIFQKSIRLYVSFMSASLPHVLWLKEYIKSVTGKLGFLRHSNRAHTLTYSKHNSIELIGRIYYEPGLPCLKRKFKIAQEFIKPG